MAGLAEPIDQAVKAGSVRENKGINIGIDIGNKRILSVILMQPQRHRKVAGSLL
jgi:hypothetical protein